MTDIIEFDFSEISFLALIFLSLTLVFIFKVINFLFIRKSTKVFVKNIYLLFQVGFWFSFTIWALNILLEDSIYKVIVVLSLVVILIAALGWFASRDLIAGIIVRFSDKINPGQSISIGAITGIIKDIGLFAVSVQQGGMTHKIPWTKINGHIYSKDSADGVVRQSFMIKADRRHKMDNVRMKIRETIFLSSGSDINKEPQIKLVETNDDYWHFEITLFTLKNEYPSHIKDKINDTLSSI